MSLAHTWLSSTVKAEITQGIMWKIRKAEEQNVKVAWKKTERERPAMVRRKPVKYHITELVNSTKKTLP